MVEYIACINESVEFLDSIHAAVIVRCKDCIYFKQIKEESVKSGYIGFCKILLNLDGEPLRALDDGFCSRAISKFDRRFIESTEGLEYDETTC